MGLRDLEPELDLRFVERSKGKVREIPIEKFPCVIGHSGDVAPTLLNGTISNRHCTVRYDLSTRSYSVEDGADGKPSSNGIYFGDGGGETKEVDRAVLSKLGEKVYVLRLISGEEGFIELYDSKKESFCGRSTENLDPELVLTKALADEAHTIATQNAKHIAELEGKTRQALIVFNLITANPLRTFIGILLVLFALYGVMPFLLRDQIADFVIERERHKNHPEYRK